MRPSPVLSDAFDLKCRLPGRAFAFFPLATPDLPLEALAHALSANRLTGKAGRTLFLRARPGAALRGLGLTLRCTQTFRPVFDALQRDGFEVGANEDAASETAPLVLLLPPRQKEEMRALLAHAVSRCGPGGQVVASVANDEGARSVEKDLARLTGLGGSIAKHHCRVFWSPPLHGSHDAALLEQWRQLDGVRPILGGRFQSRPGVFAWDRIDPASQLLADALPANLRGSAADLGSGWGFLADALLTRCAGIASLDLFEAEQRALALAERNLAPHAARVALGFHWHDVAAGLPRKYDLIVSNPPFHALARGERPDIGRRFIEVAASSLNRNGQLWLVANRHLPYEAVLEARFEQVRVAAESAGFKVIAATGARA
ncbi:class I SAM-dependent methyltransferase [Pseudoxanthomonas sp. X-1]|uniref:class I SAM-dependent methyltransferase n=1 Tax=Pseudoxanthomonas sp. X-1 TaxID=2571115 RepID=UPI00110B64E7|nr:class I SAM-dependent methyltransferase [Pseudoxanthomonas sp. X-1]TMN18015.1 class I SAM-dependent methyltransferase [Pseudoxanthomonas sp. X-1]UAY74253.1 class I SAM-dependent methyltransferase [Pseudoxanthomonas sp. X-1]